MAITMRAEGGPGNQVTRTGARRGTYESEERRYFWLRAFTLPCALVPRVSMGVEFRKSHTPLSENVINNRSVGAISIPLQFGAVIDSAIDYK